jgi:hypothetical protein
MRIQKHLYASNQHVSQTSCICTYYAQNVWLDTAYESNAQFMTNRCVRSAMYHTIAEEPSSHRNAAYILQLLIVSFFSSGKGNH